MKKLICMFVLLLVLSGCTPSSNASKKGISAATQAIQVIDDYIDGKCAYEEASSALDEQRKRMDYTHDFDYPMSSEESADYDISRYILFASSRMLLDHIGGNADTFNNLVEARNKLAELAGLETR